MPFPTVDILFRQKLVNEIAPYFGIYHPEDGTNQLSKAGFD